MVALNRIRYMTWFLDLEEQSITNKTRQKKKNLKPPNINGEICKKKKQYVSKNKQTKIQPGKNVKTSKSVKTNIKKIEFVTLHVLKEKLQNVDCWKT